jgi:hypothetical protein
LSRGVPEPPLFRLSGTEGCGRAVASRSRLCDGPYRAKGSPCLAVTWSAQQDRATGPPFVVKTCSQSESREFFVAGATQNSQGPLIACTSSATVRPLMRPKGTEQPQRRSKSPERRRTGLRLVVGVMNGGRCQDQVQGVDKNPRWNCAPASRLRSAPQTQILTAQGHRLVLVKSAGRAGICAVGERRGSLGSQGQPLAS